MDFKAEDFTKTGYVYLAGPCDGAFKIGTSIRLRDRIRELGLTGRLLFQIATPWAYWVERHVHQHFAEHRVHGEWFSLTETQVKTFPAVVEQYRPSQEQVEQRVRHFIERARRDREQADRPRGISNPVRSSLPKSTLLRTLPDRRVA